MFPNFVWMQHCINNAFLYIFCSWYLQLFCFITRSKIVLVFTDLLLLLSKRPIRLLKTVTGSLNMRILTLSLWGRDPIFFLQEFFLTICNTEINKIMRILLFTNIIYWNKCTIFCWLSISIIRYNQSVKSFKSIYKWS